MSELITTLFSTEASAQEKVDAIAELFKALFNYILGHMDAEGEIE